MSDAINPTTEVPEGEEPIQCPYCDRPFASVSRRDLHVGEVHADAMTEDEREAYDAAVEAETDEMWLYHFKVVVVLLALYMVTGLLFLIALS
jgi:hypothetical protein